MSISNVLTSDQEVLAAAVHLYCDIASPLIMDVTYNTGRMWKGLSFQPHITIDKNPETPAMVHIDHHMLRLYCEELADVIVYDPPHMESEGDRSTVYFNGNYGLDGVRGDNVNSIFNRFFEHIYPVLTSRGILLAKIADMQRNHTFQSQATAMELAALSCGFTLCTKFIKIRSSGGPESGKWKNQYSPRNLFSYWYVFRKTGKAERLTKEPAFVPKECATHDSDS